MELDQTGRCPTSLVSRGSQDMGVSPQFLFLQRGLRLRGSFLMIHRERSMHEKMGVRQGTLFMGSCLIESELGGLDISHELLGASQIQGSMWREHVFHGGVFMSVSLS